MEVNVNKRTLVLVAALVVNSIALSAHHSITAIYDIDKLVPLAGVITRVSTANPHLTVDVKETSPQGGETTWTIEMAPSGALKLRGFDLRMLKAGLPVVIESWLRKDGRYEATGRTLVLDGKRFDVGDSVNWPGPK